MTEAEWLACEDLPVPFVVEARKRLNPDPARFRDLSLRWCGRVRHLLEDDDRQLFDRYMLWTIGKGVHPRDQFRPMESIPLGFGRDAWGRSYTSIESLIGRDDILHAAALAAQMAGWWDPEGSDKPHLLSEFAAEFRDITGNPFRPVTLDPRWRTTAALGLASAVYADRSFDRLPILADALEEAGCDSADILTHCRGGGPHVRGCWVVDLILGKS